MNRDLTLSLEERQRLAGEDMFNAPFSAYNCIMISMLWNVDTIIWPKNMGDVIKSKRNDNPNSPRTP